MRNDIELQMVQRLDATTYAVEPLSQPTRNAMRNDIELQMAQRLDATTVCKHQNSAKSTCP